MKLVKLPDDKLMFYCRGCGECHYFDNRWSFNNNFDKPTFSPSLLISGVQEITDEEYDLIMSGVKIKPRPKICHSFVVGGKMQFLSDCTHSLAGQTVDLIDEEDWFIDSEGIE